MFYKKIYQLFFLFFLSLCSTGFSQIWDTIGTVATTTNLPTSTSKYDIAVNDSGDAIIVWIYNDQLYSSELLHGTTTWSSPINVTLSAGKSFNSIKAVLDINRNAAISVTLTDVSFATSLTLAYKAFGQPWTIYNTGTSLPDVALTIDSNGLALCGQKSSPSSLNIKAFNDTISPNIIHTIPMGGTTGYQSSLLDIGNGNGDLVAIWVRGPTPVPHNFGFSSRINGIWSTPVFFGLVQNTFGASSSHNGRVLALSDVKNGSNYDIYGYVSDYPNDASDWTGQLLLSSPYFMVATNIGINPDTGFGTGVWVDSNFNVYSSSILAGSTTWSTPQALLTSGIYATVAIDVNDISIAVWLNDVTDQIEYSTKIYDQNWSAPEILSNPSVVAESPKITSSPEFMYAVWVEPGTILFALHTSIPPPPTPTNFTNFFNKNRFVTQAELIANLSWNPSQGAVSYSIYSDSQLTQLVGSTSGTSFIIHNFQPGISSTYYLVAVNSTGQSSPISITIKGQ